MVAVSLKKKKKKKIFFFFFFYFFFFFFFFFYFFFFFGCFFFFQAEDGIRDRDVTGVQTCALPISRVGKEGKDFRLLKFRTMRPNNISEKGSFDVGDRKSVV